MYKIGLVSVSFRNLSPKQLVLAATNVGLSCIEWGSDVHAPQADIKRLEDIRKLQIENEIHCSSYGTYFRLGVTPVEELKDYISAAKILGTDILRLWCGNKSSADYTQTEKQELFEQCRTAAKIAKEHAVTLCMECHNDTYTDTLSSALELMNEVNSPAFQMYWQPNQYNTFEENIEYAGKISKYTKHIHVFNWIKDQKLPLNEAIPTWQKYLSCFSGNCTLLLEFMPDGKIQSLPNETNALKQIITLNQ